MAKILFVVIINLYAKILKNKENVNNKIKKEGVS